MHLMERKTGVGTGGRGRGGSYGGSTANPPLFLRGRRGGVTDICLGNIFTHWLALLNERGLWMCCVCEYEERRCIGWGPLSGGSVKTQKFVAIHAFIMELNGARKCPPGTTRQTSRTHTCVCLQRVLDIIHTLSSKSLGHLTEMFFGLKNILT